MHDVPDICFKTWEKDFFQRFRWVFPTTRDLWNDIITDTKQLFNQLFWNARLGTLKSIGIKSVRLLLSCFGCVLAVGFWSMTFVTGAVVSIIVGMLSYGPMTFYLAIAGYDRQAQVKFATFWFCANIFAVWGYILRSALPIIGKFIANILGTV